VTQDTSPPNKTRSFWRALGNVLKVLLQLILIVIFMGALGAGLYFAIPWLYRATIVPVQNNTADIADLSGRVDQAEAQVDQRTEALQARNADLEGELAELHETVAVQDRILATAAAQLATLVPGMDGLYVTTGSQTEELAKLEQTLTLSLRELDDQSKLLDAQATVLDEQGDGLTDLQTELTAQTDALAEQSEDLAAQKAEILGRMALLQTAQDVVRVQLLLLEDNVGAAQESLALAVEHLTRAAALSPELAVDAAGWVERISTLSTLIDERSFRAAPALDSLWADIADRVLPPPPEGSTPLLLLSPEGTVLTTTVTGTLTLTSTVVATPTPTPTPYITLTPTPTPTPKP